MPETVSQRIGFALKAQALKQGLSARQIAQRCGVTHVTVSELFAGRRPYAQFDIIVAIAEVLGVSIDDLLSSRRRASKDRLATTEAQVRSLARMPDLVGALADQVARVASQVEEILSQTQSGDTAVQSRGKRRRSA